MNRPHPAEIHYVETPLPPEERFRVRWCDDAGRMYSGVMVRGQRWAGHLVRAVVRLDGAPERTVAVSLNDLEYIGPADVSPPSARPRPVLSVIQGGA